MTRKERIEDLQNQIYSKRKEISELENMIKSERVADFYERHISQKVNISCTEGKNTLELNMIILVFLRHIVSRKTGNHPLCLYIFITKKK